MVALVSTGGYTWKLEVLGHIPPRDKWTNIGVRWRPLSGPEYGDLPFGYTPKDDEEAHNVGGLAVIKLMMCLINDIDKVLPRSSISIWTGWDTLSHL